MPSKRVQVSEKLKDLIAGAAPYATVLGLTPDQARPEPLEEWFGQVVIRSGDPGQPDIDLSPPAYNYDHDFPVEIAGTDRERVDQMMIAIGGAIDADRTLGGLCTWLEAEAPTDGEMIAAGAAAAVWAEFRITASYTTSSPLA